MGKKYVTFSFDDGTLQDEKLAMMFDRYKIKCTFNINSGHLGLSDELTVIGITVDHSHIKPERIAEVYKNHEVSVHTVNHPELIQCDDEKIIFEVDQDRKNLEALVNYPIVGMAYPYGPFYNDHVIDVILKNTPIIYARDGQCTHDFKMPEELMKWQPTCHYRDLLYSDILDKFIAEESDEDLLLYIYGHSYEFDMYNEWEIFEGLLQRLSNTEGLTFATNRELINR